MAVAAAEKDTGEIRFVAPIRPSSYQTKLQLCMNTTCSKHATLGSSAKLLFDVEAVMSPR
jgi:hypothetical protein